MSVKKPVWKYQLQMSIRATGRTYLTETSCEEWRWRELAEDYVQWQVL
jgi:hypothetical protein